MGRCRPAQQALVPVPANPASSRSATSGLSTTLAPPLDKPRPGAQLPPLAQAPTLTGSMVSARPPAHRPPAHRTPPPQPPQPPQQPQPQQLPQQPQPLRRLLPQLQRRPRPAALQAHSPLSTATPASATPSDSTSAAPSPAPAPHRQPQQRQQRQQQRQPQQLLQPVRWTPDLQPASLVSFPSHTAAPPSRAVPSGCTGGRTRASSGAAPRLTRPAPT